MIYAYVKTPSGFERSDVAPGAKLPEGALWIDMVEPTPEERRVVETAWNLALPTHEKIREIESSSRLYAEGDASYMTATILVHADAPNPSGESLTFILNPRGLVTIRYTEPRPIATYAARLLRHPEICASGEEVLVGLLEAFVDRIADVLEKVSLDLDDVSQVIFSETYRGARHQRRRRIGTQAPDLQTVLKALGRNEDITSTVRESLLSLTRLIRFVSPTMDTAMKRGAKEMKARLKTVRGDIMSLNEHASFESSKVNFLLDATLGMINIEQNRIIKIFSIAAVVFLPPTLVASVYGMNFAFMPELDWILGYPLALGLMAISAAGPLLYFRRMGWL